MRNRANRSNAARCLLWATCCLAVAAPAHAQIYTWRDANGHLVLSNRPAGGGDSTYVVPQAPSVRATRPVVAARGREYDELIAEHARLNAVRTDLVRAVVQVESAFNPNAKSSQGRAWSDAIDAGDDSAVRREESVRPRGKHSGRRGLLAPAPGSVRQRRAARARGIQRRPWSGRPARPERPALRSRPSSTSSRINGLTAQPVQRRAGRDLQVDRHCRWPRGAEVLGHQTLDRPL